MNKYNLDKPIIFDKPVSINVPRSIQTKAQDFANKRFIVSSRQGKSILAAYNHKKVFVDKIGESAVGQWMRQELNAPLIPTNFDIHKKYDADFPYHSEYGKLKDIHVETCFNQIESIGWNFEKTNGLYKNGSRNDVVALVVAKNDQVVDGNNIQLYAVFPWLFLKSIIDELDGDDTGIRHISWELLCKRTVIK